LTGVRSDVEDAVHAEILEEPPKMEPLRKEVRLFLAEY
jgi:hypothetical protein